MPPLDVIFAILMLAAVIGASVWYETRHPYVPPTQKPCWACSVKAAVDWVDAADSCDERARRKEYTFAIRYAKGPTAHTCGLDNVAS